MEKLEAFITERINKMKKKLDFKKILLIIFFYILGIISLTIFFMIMIILYILAYILIKPVIS
jgi:hypothetical protein